jgi:hypothetical protein
MRWTLQLWPGLPQCLQGSFAGLAIALLLAIVLNGVLIGTYGWSELFAPKVRNGLWIALAAVWLAAQVLTLGWRYPAGGKSVSDDGFFSQALAYYLKGNWFEAERTLNQRLASDPSDLDARMMLASLLRHTRRVDEAQQQLDMMERYEGAYRWDLEIARERRLLADVQVSDHESGRAEDGPTPENPPPEIMHAA